MRILIVQRCSSVADSVERALQQAGFRTLVTDLGEEAVEFARDEIVDAIVLDLRLTDGDGFEVISALRADGSDVPMIVVTAETRWPERVRALDIGADMTLSVPFDRVYLAAAVKAAIRRRHGAW